MLSALASWGEVKSPCPAIMGKKKKMKRFLGGLKLAAKLQHQPLDNWDQFELYCIPEHCLTLQIGLQNPKFIQESWQLHICQNNTYPCKSRQNSRTERGGWVSLFPSLLADQEICSAGEVRCLKQM